MDRRFCVYAHFVEGEQLPFYVGEGTAKRSRSSSSRNRYWNFKVSMHGGFRVELIADGLLKSEAEILEFTLIHLLRLAGAAECNFCDGPWYRSWLAGAPKEIHPAFGRRFSAPWVAESNRRRAGQKLKPRPDLAERNRTSRPRHFTRPVQCIETGVIYESVVRAAEAAGVHDSKIHRAMRTGWMSGGFHWRHVSEERLVSGRKLGKTTKWRHAAAAAAAAASSA